MLVRAEKTPCEPDLGNASGGKIKKQNYTLKIGYIIITLTDNMSYIKKGDIANEVAMYFNDCWV